MTAGGLLLVPLALFLEPPLPALTLTNVAALAFLAIIGGALAYLLWFRGIGILGASTASLLALLSPVIAVLVGWLALRQTLSLPQTVGILVVLGSVWVGQRSQRPTAQPIAAAAQPQPL